ncbi:hypothetical protein SHELI_v1c00160 [Spiroplasma helicoides]|uniref:DUF1904 domain-containing protein n=1 Tax=Spiroplasma helicoides TaxID=216938 RepID=A0A1B3SJ68_9MOLU|nr:DUF1904 family protein [Spiroplasma helicoides]AOG59971.1 hypothetical protein SHELI_v1c00160 [Spiroplasma helicoides]
MPIFSFKGVSIDEVKEYSKKVGELSQIINVDVKEFVFWWEETEAVWNGHDKHVVMVSIDWVGRPVKQEPVTKHLMDFFAKNGTNVYVKFTEINNFMYLNGKVKG